MGYPVFAEGEEDVPDDGHHVHVQHPVPLRHVREVQPLRRRPDAPVKLANTRPVTGQKTRIFLFCWIKSLSVCSDHSSPTGYRIWGGGGSDQGRIEHCWGETTLAEEVAYQCTRQLEHTPSASDGSGGARSATQPVYDVHQAHIN